MVPRNPFLASIGAILCVLYFGTASCGAADRSQSLTQQLINRPVCWSPEQPDPSRYCDFAQKSYSR